MTLLGINSAARFNKVIDKINEGEEVYMSILDLWFMIDECLHFFFGDYRTGQKIDQRKFEIAAEYFSWHYEKALDYCTIL